MSTTSVPSATFDESEVLTSEQVAAFDRDGFLRLEALTSAEEVAGLQVVYDRLFSPDAILDDADRVELAGTSDEAALLPQVLNPDRYAPELRQTRAYAAGLDLARQLLGPGTEAMGMHAIRKPPRHGARTPWHQDEAYWDPRYDHPAVSVWVPLQPATVENGCLAFVPGSHRAEVVEHELTSPGCAEGLQAVRQDVGPGVVCPLPPGGATVHAGRTLHSAGGNLTDEPRRALIMAFRAPPRLRSEDRTFPWQPVHWQD